MSKALQVWLTWGEIEALLYPGLASDLELVTSRTKLQNAKQKALDKK